MLLLERPELVDGVEACFLDADARIEVGEREDVTLDFGIRPDRPLIAIGDHIAAPVAVLVQEDEVHAPGVDADGVDFRLLHRLVNAGLNKCDELVDVPAVVSFLSDL